MKFLYDFTSQIIEKTEPLEEVSRNFVYTLSLGSISNKDELKTILSDTNNFINNYSNNWSALYAYLSESGEVMLLIQADFKDLDPVLMKLSASSYIIKKITKTEFNKEVQEHNAVWFSKGTVKNA